MTLYNKILTKKDIHHWMAQSVSCCHNLDITIFILNLGNVLVDEIPSRITKSQLKPTNLWRMQVLIRIWLAIMSIVYGQDEPNLVLRLVSTRVDKIMLSCPLGTTHCVPQEKFSWKPYILNKSFIDQACSVKMDIGLVHLLLVYGLQLHTWSVTYRYI